MKKHSREACVNRPSREGPHQAVKPRFTQKRYDEQERPHRDEGAADALQASAPRRTTRNEIRSEQHVEQRRKEKIDVAGTKQKAGPIGEPAKVVVADVHVEPTRQEGAEPKQPK